MAFLPQNHLSKEEIEENFDYIGLMFGFIPVYIRLFETEDGMDSNIAVRNWWPEWLLDFASFMAEAYLMIADDEFVSLPIKITGEIVK